MIGAAAASSPLEAVRRATLDNGLTVLVAEEPGSPLVTVAMAYKVGARNEAAGATGLAHYAEHMTFRGTRKFPGHELSDSITRRGGRTSAYTWIDQTYYSSTLEGGGLDHLLEVEAERMSHATFGAQDFRKERTSVLAELRSYDDPQSLLYDAVLAASFEIHPYRNNTIGWLSDVEGLTRDEAYAFYRRYYQPNNAVLVVAGDVRAEEVLVKVRARFGALAGVGESTLVRAIEPAAAGPKRIALRRPGPHARVVVAFRAPSLSDPDFPALVLFDALLAGGRGFAGGILRSAGHGGPYPAASGTVLDQATAGLATAVRSDWQASTYPYVYTLSATVPKADGLAPAEAALFRALETAAARAWTEADVSRAHHQVRTAVALDLDDQRGRVHQIALFEVAGGLGHFATLRERLARVSIEDVRRFARERLGADRATVGWFEPTEATAEPARIAEPAASELTVPAPPSTAPALGSEPPPRSGVPTTAASPLPSRTTLRLGSGLAAAVEVQAGAALASLHGRLEVGSAHDGAIPGLAALAAAALAQPLADESVEDPALTWTPRHDPAAAVNLHAAVVAASVLVEDLPKALGVLAGRINRPPPEGQAFVELKTAAMQHAAEQEASAPGQLMARALSELFPARSAMARPPWSDARSLDRIDERTFASFWKSNVTASRLRLGVAGRLTLPDVRAALDRAFPRTPATPSPSHLPVPSPGGAAAWKEVRLAVPDLLQDELLVVWPGDRSRPTDAAATEALVYLLGETGYAGRLAQALVDPGLVYSVETSLEGEGASSWLAVRTACDAKDTAEVLSRIRKTLEEAARGPFTDANRREAIAYLRGKAARSRDGSASTADALLHESTRPSGAAELTLARAERHGAPPLRQGLPDRARGARSGRRTIDGVAQGPSRHTQHLAERLLPQIGGCDACLAQVDRSRSPHDLNWRRR